MGIILDPIDMLKEQEEEILKRITRLDTIHGTQHTVEEIEAWQELMNEHVHELAQVRSELYALTGTDAKKQARDNILSLLDI